jgi:hypothetical protein
MDLIEIIVFYSITIDFDTFCDLSGSLEAFLCHFFQFPKKSEKITQNRAESLNYTYD